MDEWTGWILVLLTVGIAILGVAVHSLSPMRIVEPPPGEELGLPARIVVSGVPEGARVGVRLREATGRILSEMALVSHGGIAQGLLYYDLPTTPEGTLEAFEIPSGEVLARRPVRLPRERGRWVKVFLLDRNGDPFPAIRRIPATEAIAREAIRALLSGPTLIEERAGLHSAAPEGTELLSLEISRGKAIAVFSVPDPEDPSLEPFSLQVERTLLQFESVSRVEVRYVHF